MTLSRYLRKWIPLDPDFIIRSCSFYYYHCVDTSAGGLLDPEGIIHSVVSVTITVSRYLSWWILLDPDFISMFLLLSLCRYLCWRTIRSRGYHPHISQYYYDFKSIPQKVDSTRSRWYHPLSSFYYYHCVDTSAGGLLVPRVSSTH